MDDAGFDDIVKGKLGNYQDPDFDAGALAGLHETLNAFHPAAWYSLYTGRIVIAIAALLFTGVNTWLFWQNFYAAPNSIKTAGTGSNRTAIDSLSRIIKDLSKQQSNQVTPVQATPTVAPSIVVNKNTPAGDRARAPKNEPAVRSFAWRQEGDTTAHVGIRIDLGPVDQIPPSVYNRLLEDGLVVSADGTASITLIPPSVHRDDRSRPVYPAIALVALPSLRKPEFLAAASAEKENKTSKSGKGVTSATRDALEKHYSKGLGIELGGHLDAAQGIFSSGSGSITPRIGFVAGWVVSPHLSIETGIDYLYTNVHAAKNADAILSPDTNLGIPHDANVSSRLVSVPVGLKYRQWVSDKNQAVLRIGYTPFYSFRNEFSCSYSNYGSGGYPQKPNDFTMVQRQNAFLYYGGTLGISAGLTHNRLKSQKLETMLFYERSLGDVGTRQFTLQLVGIRAAWWFTVR